MRRGRHYATFTLRTLRNAMLGVAGSGFDPTGAGAAWLSPQGWTLDTFDGDFNHAGQYSNWEGQPQFDDLKEGDVVVRLPPPPLPHPLHVARLTLYLWCRACCSTSTRPP